MTLADVGRLKAELEPHELEACCSKDPKDMIAKMSLALAGLSDPMLSPSSAFPDVPW